MSKRKNKEIIKRPYRNIVTSRLILRQSDDERDLADYLFHLETENEFFLQYGIERSEELLELIDFHSAPVYYYTVFLKKTNTMIGYVGISPCERDETEGDVEFHIFREYRQNGYASEALSALIHSFFDGLLTGEKGRLISAETLSDNEPSIQLLLSLGFKPSAVGIQIRPIEEGPAKIVGVRCFELNRWDSSDQASICMLQNGSHMQNGIA